MGKNLGINCFTNPRIFSNHKINPTQHATGCWWWLLVFYHPRHMPPSVFNGFKAYSVGFFPKNSHRIWQIFVRWRILTKGLKGGDPASFPELINGSSSAEGGMPGFLDWRWLSFRDSPSGLASLGAWEGLFGDRVMALLLGPNPLKETNHKEKNTREKVFKDLPVSDAQKNVWVCLKIRSQHLKHHKMIHLCDFFFN